LPKIGATCKHMEYMMLVGYRGESVARLGVPTKMVATIGDKMRIIIHETYAYEVEAESAAHALTLFDTYQDGGQDTGIEFQQNMMHTYNDNMEEI